MLPAMLNRRIISHLLLLVFVPLSLLSCATHGALKIEEHFDENNLTAVIRANESALFVARKPALSAHGGDMISVGPVYTIVSTSHKQALWLGFWTTIDRHYVPGDSFSAPKEVILETESELVTLYLDPRFAAGEVVNWQSYPPTAPGIRNLYYPITDRQLRTLSNQKISLIRTRSEDGKETRYHSGSDLAVILSRFSQYMHAGEQKSVAFNERSGLPANTRTGSE